MTEVGPGEMKGFMVAGVTMPILVANVAGVFHASASMCAHEDVSLLGGKLRGTRVICPGHGYQFDLRTGTCSHDPALRLCRYRVSVIEGEIYVDLVSELV